MASMSPTLHEKSQDSKSSVYHYGDMMAMKDGSHCINTWKWRIQLSRN